MEYDNCLPVYLIGLIYTSSIVRGGGGVYYRSGHYHTANRGTVLHLRYYFR
jgi:hypothetical protein